jgi:integrase
VPNDDIAIVGWRDSALAEPAYSDRDRTIRPETARRLADSVPENTRRAYERIWLTFESWCHREGRVPLPATAETLADYVADLIEASLAPSTILQAIGGIRSRHAAAGHEARPATKAAMMLLRGYRRNLAAGGSSQRKALPLLPDALRRMISALDLDTLPGRRDQLVLVLGFAMMARRSELAALQLADVVEVDDGIEVAIRTSKTDKDSTGRVVAVPRSSHPDLDPARLVADWRDFLAGHGVDSGPLLRGVNRWGGVSNSLAASTINDIVKRVARAAGLPSADRYSAHSLRAGGLTAALMAGSPLGMAAEHGRWSPKSPVVIGYARAADRWRDNAMRGVL